MKENKYDDHSFFKKYKKMTRSLKGLEGAGEWHELKKLLPDLKNKEVLDLGCGFGWHCRYAVEHGATTTVGIDISQKMILEACNKNLMKGGHYFCMAIEDYEYPENSFDVVISSLAFHYLASFDEICKQVHKTLRPGGSFVFSVEHPIFTAQGTQDWVYDKKGNIQHWPVDHYFEEGVRKARFLGEEITKYHKTITTYVNGLISNGFEIKAIVEPKPDPNLLAMEPSMQNELRRPMMLLFSSIKK